MGEDNGRSSTYGKASWPKADNDGPVTRRSRDVSNGGANQGATGQIISESIDCGDTISIKQGPFLAPVQCSTCA
jgi:hypothetical protein